MSAVRHPIQAEKVDGEWPKLCVVWHWGIIVVECNTFPKQQLWSLFLRKFRLSSLDPDIVSTVLSIRRRTLDFGSASDRVEFTFSTINIPRRINLVSVAFDLTPVISPPERCFRCQRFRHIFEQCRSSKVTCKFCSEEHFFRDCLNTPLASRCANCGGKHPAYNCDCLLYQYEFAVMRERTLENNGYEEPQISLLSRGVSRPLFSVEAWRAGEVYILGADEAPTGSPLGKTDSLESSSVAEILLKMGLSAMARPSPSEAMGELIDVFCVLQEGQAIYELCGHGCDGCFSGERSEVACVQASTLGADAASPPISHGPEWEAESARIKAFNWVLKHFLRSFGAGPEFSALSPSLAPLIRKETRNSLFNELIIHLKRKLENPRLRLHTSSWEICLRIS